MAWLIPFDVSVFFVLVVLLRSQFPSYANYATMFVGVWVFIISVSRLGFYETYVPSHLTYGIMYLTLFVFVLTTYCLRAYERKRPEGSVQRRPARELDLSGVCYSPLILITLATSALLATYLPDALSILATGGFSSVRHNVLYSETSTYTSSSLVLLKWAINPLILAEFLIASTAIVLKKTPRSKVGPVFLLILCCCNLAMYTLIFAGRWLLMEAMLSLAVLLFHQYGLHLWELMRRNKVITAVGVLAVVVILSISGDRTIGETDVLTSIYVYFAGTVDMSPFYVVANRLLGTHIPIAITEINAVSSAMVNISPTLHMNNNCTYVYGVLRDFGAAGLLIGPAILAVVCQKIHSYYERSGSDYGLMLYVYMVVILFFMIIEWMFGRVNVVYTGIFLYMLMRFCCVGGGLAKDAVEAPRRRPVPGPHLNPRRLNG